MKTTKYAHLFNIFLVSFLMSGVFFSCTSSSKIATKPNAVEISNMINSQNFTFVAERVNPLRGSSRPLTSYYDVTVKSDTLNCYLPYFGRAFQAPIDPTKGGLNFKSYNFSYNVTLIIKMSGRFILIPKIILMCNNSISKFLVTELPL